MSDDDDPTAADATDTSAVEVLDRFEEAGWAANHVSRTDGAFKCGECGQESPGGDVAEIGAEHRIEGTSDPDDMQIVLGFACPKCSAKGALVAGYGPMASDQDQELVTALPDPGDGSVDPTR